MVRARMMKALEINVLLRADGTRGDLDLPLLQESRQSRKERSLRIVDLRDEFDSLSTAATEARIANYRERNWTILKVDHQC